MIQHLTEKEYRKLDIDSYSSVKDYLQSMLKYYKKYILKEKIDDTKTQEDDDIRFGSLTDCLKFTPEQFDSDYVITSATKPSGQMLDFINELNRLCVKNTNEHGVLCGNIESFIEESYQYLEKNSKTGKLRDSLDKFKDRFLVNQEGYDYFLELKASNSKIVITPEELEWAQSIVSYINEHPFTRDIMSATTENQYEVIDQLKLTGEINNYPLKMMSDRVIIDHDKKIIYPYDLKVMSNNEIFPYNYLKLKYYVQNAIYTSIIRQNFPTFVVNPMSFVTIHKYKQLDPVVVKTSESQLDDALYGFTVNGRKYKGVYEALEELQWHKTNGIWTTTKTISENHGVSHLVLGAE